ncbi:hypothetical protein [Amycolatopsis sp. ATCC 39116]|uniref:hypothetical protein n=1 Tax=Amycolatopsis sp. (strain ATCC 39116 / 75iv2) TaxID=385957 RepID=UPI0002627130|nr:hypothetical protein [Amycolatopsis sp. ATCC 39116]
MFNRYVSRLPIRDRGSRTCTHNGAVSSASTHGGAGGRAIHSGARVVATSHLIESAQPTERKLRRLRVPWATEEEASTLGFVLTLG